MAPGRRVRAVKGGPGRPAHSNVCSGSVVVDADARAGEEGLVAVPAMGGGRAGQSAALFRNRFAGDGTECRRQS